MSSRRGFTIIELLVVIGIIAILIAILLPLGMMVRRNGQRVVCSSQMRQVWLALRMYADENRGWLPAGAQSGRPVEWDWVHWQAGRDINHSAIASHLGKSFKVLRCPADDFQNRHDWDMREGPYPFSYAVNHQLCGYRTSPATWSVEPCKLQAVRWPQFVMLLADVTAPWQGNWAPYTAGPDEAPSARHDRCGELNRSFSQILLGRANVIFVDGHYEFLERWQTTDPLRGDPRWQFWSEPVHHPPDWKRPPCPWVRVP